jgi:hypothetical protein
MGKQISYAVRDFAGLRQELVNFTKNYYPNLIQNFNDASVYSVLLDLNAAISDNLHFHIDRVWQETMLDYAQQRQSLFFIAKTYGLKIPNTRPSVTLIDFSISVPVNGDKDDMRYEGVLKAGAQISGGGQTFETINDIDFSSPFTLDGTPNRLKIPNFDSNNRLISYTITKREPVVNGVTNVYRRVITSTDQTPFLKLYLPEQNVLGVTAVIHKDGTSYSSNPTSAEFATSPNKWYEVDSLIQENIFMPDPTSVSDSNNFLAGTYIQTDNKFVTEYTPEGYFSLTFGSGNVNPLSNLDNYINGSLQVNLATYLNNMSLGAIPPVNSTLFVQYRVGGGKASNLGVNTITSVDNIIFNVNGPNSNINNQVIQSLTITNPVPAIGGADQPSIEEIRSMVSYNFAAQNRAVTLNDYMSLIQSMPSTYGAPAKVGVMEVNNKIQINLLSYDDLGNLTDTVSTTLQNNILKYLSQYRMVNDYLSVNAAEVIDLGFQIDLVVNKNINQTDILSNVISETSSYLSVDSRKMGDPLFVGELTQIINQINGVVNVVDVRVYNKVTSPYSSAQVSQPYVDPITMEIQQQDQIIYMKSNQIYQCRFPNTDILVRVKTLGSTSY